MTKEGGLVATCSLCVWFVKTRTMAVEVLGSLLHHLTACPRIVFFAYFSIPYPCSIHALSMPYLCFIRTLILHGGGDNCL